MGRYEVNLQVLANTRVSEALREVGVSLFDIFWLLCSL